VFTIDATYQTNHPHNKEASPSQEMSFLVVYPKRKAANAIEGDEEDLNDRNIR